MRLYELSAEYRRVQELADETAYDPETGEFNDPTGELDAALDAAAGAFDAKVENIAKLIRNLRAEVDAQKTEERRIADRRKGYERTVKHLECYARDAMIATERTKLKTALFTISVRTAAPGVVVSEGAELPEEYLRPPVDRAPDKAKIKAALKAGKTIDGARFGEPTRSLVIR